MSFFWFKINLSEDVMSISCPFGLVSSQVFTSIVRKCIISSIWKEGVLVLDLNYVPGQEGGFLYNKQGIVDAAFVFLVLYLKNYIL